MFLLDPKIEKNTCIITSIGIFQIRLMLDNRYFWLLIIPEIPNLIDWHDLNVDVSADLNKLTHKLSRFIKELDAADKINVGSLGNIVPQFHLHIISRHKKDYAWPGAVWGSGEALPIPESIKNKRIKAIKSYLNKKQT